MKKLTIYKGKHRPKWWWVARFVLMRFMNTTSAKERTLIFDESWRESDQNAWHKLFGFSKGFRHHENSARWVAKYDSMNDCIDLAVYAYVDGKRIIKLVGSVEFGKEVNLYLNHINNVFEGSYYSYEMNGKTNLENGQPTYRIKTRKLSKFGWFLGLYHGGKFTAESDLIVYSDRYL